MKLLARLFALLLVAALTLGAHAWCVWSPGAPSYTLASERSEKSLPERFRDGAEHDRVRAEHPEAYVLELTKGDGALLYYGAHHTDDLGDPQLADIRARWAAFRPTVALCEGRARGYLLGPLFPRLTGMPEPALVHELARGNGVPLYSLEPEYADEVLLLLRRFQPADIALFFTLRVYWQESGGKADERLAEDLRAKRCDVDGLRTALPDLAAMDATWKAITSEGDWRTWTGDMPGVLHAIDEASRAARGEHMARVLIELVERGERVFAVVGSGHVIRQEWALRSALGAAPASDQPARGIPSAHATVVPVR
jgi:hypothetical protein